MVNAAITSCFLAHTQLEKFNLASHYKEILYHQLSANEMNFICLLQLFQNDVRVQFHVMNLNLATNFVILSKHFELSKKYLPELVVKWNLFEHRVQLKQQNLIFR